VNLKNSIIIAKRICKQIRHDKRTMAMLIITPLVIMFIFGYSFGGELTGVKVIVVNYDEGFGGENLAEKIIENLDTKVLALEYSHDEVGARESVEKGKVWAAIIFPSNFTRNILIGHAENISGVHIILDGSDPTVATGVIKAVNNALTATIEEKGWKAPISTNLEYVYGGEDVEFIDFFAPGVICMVAMMLSLVLTIISFVRERTTGTLDRLFALPITESEIVVGYALAFTLVSFIQALILFGVAILVFDILVRGNIFLAFFIIVLSALGFQGLGIMLSAAAKTEFQAVQFIPMLIIPSILLAGIFWPLEAIPSFIRPISYAIPLTYAVDALRSVTIRGWGPEQILMDLIILALFVITTLLLSFLIMRRKK